MVEIITRRKVSGVTLQIFNTGSVYAKGGAVSSMKSWAANVRLDVPVFLIKHPKEGWILFDAGLDAQTAADLDPGWLGRKIARFESLPGQDARSQLKAAGVTPEDVRWIILSHSHLDHISALTAYPKATVVIDRNEWEYVKKTAAAEPPEKRKFDPVVVGPQLQMQFVDFDKQEPYGAFDHGLDLFNDGMVILVSLPGHTPGSMGAWVNLDGGPVLLAGDAAWVIDNYMDLALPHPRAMMDPRAYRHSIDMMRAMQNVAPRLVIFPGHDLSPRTINGRKDLPLVPFSPK